MREPRGSGCVPAQTQLQALAGAPEIHVPATSLGMGPFVQMGLCQCDEGKDVRCSSWVGPVLNAATGVLVRHRRGDVATEKLTLTRPPHLAGGQLWPCVYFLVTRVTGVSPPPCRGGLFSWWGRVFCGSQVLCVQSRWGVGVGVLGISRESFREVRRDQGPRGAPVLGFHPLDAPQNMWPPEKVWAE